jgi:hypothetical protein
MEPAMKGYESQTDVKKIKVGKILHRKIKNSKNLASFVNNEFT